MSSLLNDYLLGILKYQARAPLIQTCFSLKAFPTTPDYFFLTSSIMCLWHTWFLCLAHYLTCIHLTSLKGSYPSCRQESYYLFVILSGPHNDFLRVERLLNESSFHLHDVYPTELSKLSWAPNIAIYYLSKLTTSKASWDLFVSCHFWWTTK